jgi:SAM-dependent methyltransferase
VKLSRRAAEDHARACELVAMDRPLTEDERLFVLEHWQEAADPTNVLAGAYFTPLDLARDMSLHVHGRRVLDLGAGIGRLAWKCRAPLRTRNGEPEREFVCVEINPLYVEVGRRVMPEAEWVCADLFQLPSLGLGQFDTVISNPPFSTAHGSGRGPRYRGRHLAYAVIDVARDYARNGAFLIPQDLAPFRRSGEPGFRHARSEAYDRFVSETGIELHANVGIDTTWYDDDWRGVSPRTEVVTCDYLELLPVSPRAAGEGAAQLSLWD